MVNQDCKNLSNNYFIANHEIKDLASEHVLFHLFNKMGQIDKTGGFVENLTQFPPSS